MVRIDSDSDVIAAADAAIDALECGLLDYQSQLEYWSADLCEKHGRQEIIAAQAREERTRELDQYAAQVKKDETALADAKADLERSLAELATRETQLDEARRAFRRYIELFDDLWTPIAEAHLKELES